MGFDTSRSSRGTSRANIFWRWLPYLRIIQESLAIMFEMAHLTEDALREYDEVEQIYLEIGKEAPTIEPNLLVAGLK
jgi:hypothetical protein